MVAGDPGRGPGAVEQLLAGAGAGERHPAGDRGDPDGVLVAEGEAGGGDPPGEVAELAARDVRGGLGHQHQQPAGAVHAHPDQRAGLVAEQVGDLGRDLGGRTTAEPLLQPRHLLDLHDREAARAGHPPAALELRPASSSMLPSDSRPVRRSRLTSWAGTGGRAVLARTRAASSAPRRRGATQSSAPSSRPVSTSSSSPDGEQQHRDGAARPGGAEVAQQVERCGALPGDGRGDHVGADPGERDAGRARLGGRSRRRTLRTGGPHGPRRRSRSHRPAGRSP